MTTDIAGRVTDILVFHLAAEEASVTESARLVDDLGADSLDVYEAVMSFEEEFNIEISDEDAEKITTVKDAVQYIEAHT